MSSSYNVFFEGVFALAHQPFGLGYDEGWIGKKIDYVFSPTKAVLNTMGAVPLVGGQLIGLLRIVSLVVYVASLAGPFVLFSVFQQKKKQSKTSIVFFNIRSSLTLYVA